MPSISPVAIGMPVFNCEATIEASLLSILLQTYSNFTVVIVDNGSTDRTYEIIETFASRDKRIRLLRNAMNIGVAANFSRAFSESNSEFFMFHAADDLLEIHFLEEAIEILEYSKTTVGVAPSDYFPNFSEIGPRSFEISGSILSRLMQLLNCLEISQGLFYSLFRSEHLRTYEYWGESFTAFDWCLLTHMIKQGDIKRCKDAHLSLGETGMSQKKDALTVLANSKIEKWFPYLGFVRLQFHILKDFGVRIKTLNLIFWLKLEIRHKKNILIELTISALKRHS